jgi:hypothetical protein
LSKGTANRSRLFLEEYGLPIGCLLLQEKSSQWNKADHKLSVVPQLFEIEGSGRVIRTFSNAAAFESTLKEAS